MIPMLSFEFKIRNPENVYQSIEISVKDNKTFWMNRQDGEGAEFDISDLWLALDKLYNDKF